MDRIVLNFFTLLRYRFMLIAGLLPYILGAVISFYLRERFDISLFFTGLAGILFALIGVECFNEFFDWKLGSDRVFQLNQKPVENSTFFLGIGAFFIALLIGIFLTMKSGFPIIIFSVIGFLAAFFYLGPPFRFTYRGLGEIVISLSYGPFMTLGSYYLQAQQIDILPIFVSLIPAILLFAISIMNEVPDYFQDKFVGKKNICVRLGQKNTVMLYGGIVVLFYIILTFGLLGKKFPPIAWIVFACLPISFLSFITGIRTYQNPYRFVSAIRYLIIKYILVMSIFIVGYSQ